MTKYKLRGFISTLFLSAVCFQVKAVDIFPTCEVNAEEQSISITDGYENYIAELPGGDVEYIAPAIDPNNQGKLYSRIYETDQMLQAVFDEEGVITNKQAVLDDWQNRNKLYGSPKLVDGVSVPVLMDATVLDKDELRGLTELNAAGQPIPQRTEVFSEPVHFEAETINSPTDWRNNHIPLSVYKFWGLLVPQETGSFKIRFQKDDGLIVHMDLGQGQGLETVIDQFQPISDHNDTGQRIVIARHSGGNDVFNFTANEAYPLHIQWMNYDGPHAMQMEYSPSNSNDWKIVPQDWFNAGRDPRGITSIEFETELSPSSLLPDISDLLDGFTIGDYEVAGTYSFEEGVTQDGEHKLIVSNEAGYSTDCRINIPTPIIPILIDPKAEVKKTGAGPYGNSVTILLGESVSFKGSDSVSNDSDFTVDHFDWDLGDGSANQDSADFDYIYSQAGTYNVSLTVTDEFGSDSAAVTVVVQDPPVAKAVFVNEDEEVKTLTITLGETLEVDGSLSTDSDGDIVTYNWNFGDGASDSGEMVSYEYADKGSYSVSLTVIDEDGLSSTDTINVVVRQLIAPTALVSAIIDGVELEMSQKLDPDTGKELQGFIVNQFNEVLISGINSFDEDGVVTTYLWQGLSEEQHGKETTYTASSASDKSLSLTVIDNDGLSHSLNFEIWVNEAPYADIRNIDISYEGISDEERAHLEVEGDSILISAGSALILDASASYDDSLITQYIWCPTPYFNAQMNTCDVPENPEYHVSYGATYEYQSNSSADEFITLILEDEHGASSATTFEIVKYKANYGASGSLSFAVLGFLASLLLYRRREL